jgi:signal transduction histidine kinase/CheY-like chemotaxis protein
VKRVFGKLVRDPIIQVGLIVFGLAVVFQTTAAVLPDLVGTRYVALADPLLASLTLVALLWDRSKLTGNEQRFWGLLACAWVCLVLVDLFFFELPLPLVGASFAADLLHILFYLGFVLAIDFRPHLPVTHSPSMARRQLESVAGLMVVFGLLIYFALVVLPEPLGLSLSFVPREQGLTPFLLARLSLDILILVRLVWAWVGSGGRWLWTYGFLGVASLAMSLKDALSLAQLEGMVKLDSLGVAYGAFLYLPTLLVMAAARHGHLAIGDPEVSQKPTSKPHRGTYQASRLVLYALVVPATHFLLYTLGVLDPASRDPREAFCLAYMLVLGSMAWFHQGMITKDASRALEALHEAQAKSYRSDRLEAIGRLAGGIAHDFNNYLTVIQGYGELLERRLPEDAKSDFAFIQDAAEQAGKLTSQLLAFGGRQLLRPEALDLNETVTTMGRMLERLLGEDIELEFDLDPALCVIAADQGQTEQIFVNLALNSRDAMPDGGKLTVRTRPISLGDEDARSLAIEPGDYGELVVIDTGLGMTEDVRSRLFEPFFTTKELGRGTGLGLSTVYGIVTQTGGSIEIQSSVDRGTTVRVLLPCSEAEAGEAEAEVPASPAKAVQATVLLVEDDQAVRKLAERALDGEGFRVLVAASGKQALELHATHRGSVDVVVTDVMMPEMDGLELAAQLGSESPGIAVLFMSGYPLETLRERHAELPPTMPLLHKPFTASALVSTVRGLIDSSQSVVT